MRERAHFVTFRLYEEWDARPTDILCLYAPNDPHRTCRLIAPDEHDGSDECEVGWEDPEWGHVHPMDGCAVKQYVDAGGWESVGLEPRKGIDIHRVPMPFFVDWRHGEFPTLTPAPACPICGQFPDVVTGMTHHLFHPKQ